MLTHVRITDVSPRDGLQNEPGVIATADKARLINLLCNTGVDEIEVASFVSPKWVPQLADRAELLKLINPSPEGRGRGGVSPTQPPPLPPNPTSTSLQYTSPPRDPIAAQRARELRTLQSGPEGALWSQLRQDNKLGTHFRRQHPFGPYILDFFSHDCALAIEVDGQTHAGAGARARDADRQAYIERHGVAVLRISNDDVVKNLEGVLRFIKQRVRERLAGPGGVNARNPTPAPPLGGGVPETEPMLPAFSVLIPNEQGLAAALACIDAGARIDKASVFTAASESFNQRNTNATIAQSIDRFRPVVEQAHARGLPVRAYISCAIACPLQGPIAPAQVARVARMLVELGVDELDLADTIGAATPETTRLMLNAVLAEIGHEWLDTESLTLHLHDTLGHADDSVRAALDLGLRSFDGSAAGLGGCPYASTPGKRAPGNISTDLLVRTITSAGYTTRVNLDALAIAGQFATRIVNQSRAATPGNTP